VNDPFIRLMDDRIDLVDRLMGGADGGTLQEAERLHTPGR
jgi:hypothetical protein